MSTTNRNSKPSTIGHIGRRSFLRKSAAASTAASIPYFVPTGVLAKPGSPGANDRVRVGIIGTGGRAGTIVKSSSGIRGMQIVSVCDCFAPRCNLFAKNHGAGQDWTTYEDFRKMIEKENLDGVMVETTTHARAWVVIQAMQAGMDAYIEKPMSLTIAEGRQMVDAARHYDSITQVGTQQRSIPLNNWASDLVKNGAIGKIKTVLAPNFVGPDVWKPLPAEEMPRGGSENWWDVWTNQAEMRPYHSQIHRGWTRWEAYDSGGLCYGVTGWGTHSYDQIQRALGTDETGPVEIELEEPVRYEKCGKFENIIDDATHLEYLHRLAKPVEGPRAKMRMKYANGTELRLHLDGDWGPGLGAIFVGEKGKIEINRDKIASNPKELATSPDNPGSIPAGTPETQYHIENWVDCIKSRKRCNADIEYGQRASTICYLVNIVRKVGEVGKKLQWDPAAERFTNCDEANTMLSRPRREGYELPDLA